MEMSTFAAEYTRQMGQVETLIAALFALGVCLQLAWLAMPKVVAESRIGLTEIVYTLSCYIALSGLMVILWLS